MYPLIMPGYCMPTTACLVLLAKVLEWENGRDKGRSTISRLDHLTSTISRRPSHVDHLTSHVSRLTRTGQVCSVAYRQDSRRAWWCSGMIYPE